MRFQEAIDRIMAIDDRIAYLRRLMSCSRAYSECWAKKRDSKEKQIFSSLFYQHCINDHKELRKTYHNELIMLVRERDAITLKLHNGEIK